MCLTLKQLWFWGTEEVVHFVSLPASGPAEAWWTADFARWPSGRKPDAGAVRQVGGRKHQNEALDGGDLCAFNRQRQAVVQVEVTSFSPSSPFLLLTVAKVKWCGMEQAMERKELHFAACWHLLLLPYHTSPLHVSYIFFNTTILIWFEEKKFGTQTRNNKMSSSVKTYAWFSEHDCYNNLDADKTLKPNFLTDHLLCEMQTNTVTV